jgi:rifampicin phosphotransferase
MNFVLEGEALTDAALAGGKGAALAKLGAAFPVPAFFVISADAFDADGMKAAARADVERALAGLGSGPFAVRSSGREEDGAGAAHAGQFATELNVPVEAVIEAACRIWRSGFTETLAQYRRAHGLSDAPQPPAVIVQTMVAARAAGVAFSADPVTGERSVAVISAVAGLADRLVGGEVDGDSYRVDGQGRTLETQLVDGAPVLAEAERAMVAALARRAEQHFGQPQDIEWAIDGAGLRLLQSRPITTLDHRTQGAPAASAGDQADLVIWDNSNIVESYPGVVSPLTFSFARYVYSHVYQAFALLMGVKPDVVADRRHVFEIMLGRVEGRVYYNLLNWYRALALFPGFKANRAFMENMMGVSEALPKELAEAIAPPTTSRAERARDQRRLARVALGLVAHQMRIRRTIRAFYGRLNEALARDDASIARMDLPQLAAEYRALERRLLSRWDAPLINDFLCMIAFGVTQKAMAKWGGAAGEAYMSAMLIGQGDIISAEPARRIREMGAVAARRPDIRARLGAGDAQAVRADPDLARLFEAYLQKFGDRCTQELKLESRTLHEDPTQLVLAIGAAASKAGGAGSPAPTSVSEGGGQAGELREVIQSPLKRWAARKLLEWTKARVRDRENLRFERTRLFGRVRRIFLAIGARLTEAGALGAPRDVFHLTVEELLGAVEGSGVTHDLKALARLREAELERDLARPDPPERLEMRGAHILASHAEAYRAPTGAGDEVRKGLACCRGVVTAKVRVIEDPRVEALAPGEILVARHTDPGWIAVFANAAGVIAERGSLLSHSAIVAREMGVPCVVAVKGVTRWLSTGDTVRLDGGAGTVERVR